MPQLEESRVATVKIWGELVPTTQIISKNVFPLLIIDTVKQLKYKRTVTKMIKAHVIEADQCPRQFSSVACQRCP